VTVPDSSVLVAGFDPSHPFFPEAQVALVAVSRAGRLVAHTIAETFAVLTAAAGPYPAAPEDVVAYLAPFLGEEPIGVAPAAYPDAVGEMAATGVAGGAVYDGLIGLAARQHDAKLVSLDVRAARTYSRLRVRFRLLAGVGSA
jgi:predicted nucleic acid-binding protein